MARGDSGRELSGNLKSSVGAARSLTFALGDMGGKLGQAAALSGTLAQNIAKAAGATKVLTTGLTFGVAAIASIVAGVLAWKDGTKELQQSIAGVRREIDIINANAGGDKRLANELAIIAARDRELDQAKANESFLRKRLSPQLYDDLIRAINAKAAAEIAANNAVFASAFSNAQRQDFATIAQNQLARGSDRDRATFAASEARRIAIGAAKSEFFGGELRERLARIEEVYASEVERIEFETIRPMAEQLGRGFAGAISDGITTAMQTGSLGKGFKALTGGILIAIGQMMEEIGTKALLASNLFTSLFAVFGTPAGIPAALALIAAGAAVKGVGQALAGSTGGASGGFSGGGVSGQTVINRGLVNPAGSTSSAGNLGMRPVILLQPTIFGTRDADAQRGFLDMMDLALARR